MANSNFTSSFSKNNVRSVSDDHLDDADDFVDPRVQIELEQLNSATDVINKLEVKLDEARATYRHLLSESSQKIRFLANKLGNCIEKAQPYYEARMKMKEIHVETQKAALRFERANSDHIAAKEMVYLAEEGLIKEGMTFDPVWQEMLNHATEKVNKAERERTLSKQEHRCHSQMYNEAEQRVLYLQKELKRTISKSSLSTRRSLLQLNSLAYQHQLLLLPYYEMKADFNQKMEEQKQKVQKLEKEILRVKQSYSVALHNLEEISVQIHQQRQQKQRRRALGLRGSGVGAESPAPPPRDRVSSAIDAEIDDTYLRLPYKITPVTNSATCTSGKSFQSPTEPAHSHPLICSNSTDEILRVDNASQTESMAENSIIPFFSDHKSRTDRVSAWVHESGLRMLAAARSASLLPGPESEVAGNLAAMLMSATEESDRSDVESLNSTDVLTDEQITHLMLDKDLDDVYQDIAFGNNNGKGNGNGPVNKEKQQEFMMSELALNDLLKKCSRKSFEANENEGENESGTSNEKTKHDVAEMISSEVAVLKEIELSPAEAPTSEVLDLDSGLKIKENQSTGSTHSDLLKQKVNIPEMIPKKVASKTGLNIEATQQEQSLDSSKKNNSNANSSQRASPNDSFSFSSPCSPDAVSYSSSGGGSGPPSEYKVVAVQFTVQETVTTPKFARRASKTGKFSPSAEKPPVQSAPVKPTNGMDSALCKNDQSALKANNGTDTVSHEPKAN